MVVGKISRKSNETVTLLPKTWLLEKPAESPTKWLLCSRNIVAGKINKKSSETVTLLPKHDHWKSQQKVQQNSYSPPETWLLEKSAKIPMKQLLCSQNMVVGKISEKSNEISTLLPKPCWKYQP